MDTMRRLSLARLGALALAAGLAAGCAKAPAKFNGVDITGADYGRSLSMTDADGKRRSLDEFKGKVVVVFFGYTQCPDVCPTTLAELAAIKQKLGPAGDKLVGVFVSVDPERDTPQVLKAYVNSFGADFVALRGSLDETKAVARDLRSSSPGARQGRGQLHHGPHRRVVRVRHPGAAAPVRTLRHRTGRAGWRLKALIDGADARVALTRQTLPRSRLFFWRRVRRRSRHRRRLQACHLSGPTQIGNCWAYPNRGHSGGLPRNFPLP